jgi:glucosamine-6-phosphate deaminase
MYDTLEDFYLAEALEYIHAWKQATPDNPAGICGPIGPTEQLPLVARLVNDLGISIKDGHFWGMDEWYDEHTKKEVSMEHPLSFERADRELCFDRMQKKLCMPDTQLHFPKADTAPYIKSWQAACAAPSCRAARATSSTGPSTIPSSAPANGRTSRRRLPSIASSPPASWICIPSRSCRTPAPPAAATSPWSPKMAITVGPKETWMAEKVSIWHAGMHDNPLGQRLTALMISKRLADAAVPMSLLADHQNVQFNYFRGGLGHCEVEMH